MLALEEPTAEQISTAYQNLANAIQNLKKIVDNTTLEQLYKANENRNEDTYSVGSWATFQTAMENAKAVLDNADATQTEINEATAALQSAVDGLVNISTLEYVLGIANGHVAAGDVDKLIPTAKEQFNKALASAQAVYDDPNATQEQVDSAWKMLMTVIQALGFVPGDKTELATLVESMKTVDLGAYEDGAEKDAFKEALAEAEALLADDDAMELDIKAAVEALEDAFAALKPLPVAGDKSELKKAIDVAEGFDLSLYVDDANKESFLEILAEAKDMYDNNDTASQAEIDAMTKKLLDASASLRLRADKETLNKWLEALKGLDLSQYTEASAAAVRAAIANAEALAAEDLGTDQQALIQAAIAQMQNAYSGLELSAQEPAPSDPGDDSSSDGKPATDDVPTTGDSLPLIAISTLGIAVAGAWLLIRKKRSV